MMRSAVMALLAMFAAQFSPGAAAEAQFKMRASVDTSATHGRTLAVGDYLKNCRKNPAAGSKPSCSTAASYFETAMW